MTGCAAFNASYLSGLSLTNLEGGTPASLTFAHIQPADLPVVEVSVVSNHTALAPESFGVQIDTFVSQYLRHKLRPDGVSGEGALKAVVENLKITESYEPRGNKVIQFFELSGFDVYTMTVAVNLQFNDMSDYKRYGTGLEFERSAKVPEHSSLARRDIIQMELLESIIGDMDREINLLIQGMF